jgi:molybdenum cofactor guanylyltransferase
MGQDKALMPFLGQPLISRLVAKLENLAAEVLVITNQPDSYRFLDLPLVEDLLPGYGALGGLYTALSSTNRVGVILVACDMPFADCQLLEKQAEMLFSEGVDVVMPKTPDGLEPFHAVYRRKACLSPVEAALKSGRRRMDSWLSEVNTRYLSLEEIHPYDPEGTAFLNVNTPEDFQRAEEYARLREG